MYYDIEIKKNEKREGLIGYIGRKVAFINFSFPKPFTGLGNFKVDEKNIIDKGNFYIVTKVILPKPEMVGKYKDIKLYRNACACRLCNGVEIQNATYLAGARNPRAYFFDEKKYAIECLTSNGYAKQFTNPDFPEDSYIEIYNHGETWTEKGEIVLEDSDSDHGCYKITEHQSVIFYRKF